MPQESYRKAGLANLNANSLQSWVFNSFHSIITFGLNQHWLLSVNTAQQSYYQHNKPLLSKEFWQSFVMLKTWDLHGGIPWKLSTRLSAESFWSVTQTRSRKLLLTTNVLKCLITKDWLGGIPLLLTTRLSEQSALWSVIQCARRGAVADQCFEMLQCGSNCSVRSVKFHFCC